MSTTSFTDFLAAAATAVATVQTVIADGQKLYGKLAELIANTEAAFAKVPNAGTTKKAIVMAGISVFVAQIGQAWDAVKDLLSAFVDSVISAYKAVTAVAQSVPQS